MFVESLIRNLQQEVPKELDQVAKDVLVELTAGNFNDRTGALRSSMNVVAEDYSLRISMLEYGYYVSFGVSGGDYTGQELADEVAGAFGTTLFESKARPNWGISPRRFYPTDIEQRILDTLEIIE